MFCLLKGYYSFTSGLYFSLITRTNQYWHEYCDCSLAMQSFAKGIAGALCCAAGWVPPCVHSTPTCPGGAAAGAGRELMLKRHTQKWGQDCHQPPDSIRAPTELLYLDRNCWDNQEFSTWMCSQVQQGSLNSWAAPASPL